MSSSYTYKVLKSSWGVIVTIVAEAVEADSGDANAIPLGSGIGLLDATPRPSLSDLAMKVLAGGLKPLAAEISSAVGGAERVIVIRDVRYNEMDFQIEGLAAAIHGWATAEFGLPKREIAVSFNRDEKRYVFTLPGGDSF